MPKALLFKSKDDGHWSDLPEGDFPDEPVTLRVSHSALNYKDALALTGRSPILRKFPVVPGVDMVGTVLSDRSGTFLPGEKVIATGWSIGEVHWGAFAEIARLKPEWLVRLPEGLSEVEAMATGTAGFTAMLAVQALEAFGIRPGEGPVLVTGATGGVGGHAVALLAKAGFEVVAATGRPAEGDYLRDLGASAILDRAELEGDPRPLGKERWRAAIDVAGGKILANVVSMLQRRGAVAVTGLAQSMDLPASVAPLILRGVSLLGIDSVMSPQVERFRAWERLARDLDREHLAAMMHLHPFEDVQDLASPLLDQQLKGRVVLHW
ncbi:acrylyl-CoA reductase (NADPH) [Faunimonas pinastri]|uniref:Acrylyl-CoA reductase (NADPH) n=1 Tax=Faunimonas pinastri TaxID=1855383 RepID=A0A1H9CUA0_9HYPH|nr:MDR family oxidoreductase [Faunimonas pinastri]SEQ04792.1 acrylyl-CoA reductase (NADPH) [Faunimonas pinastri]